MNEEQVRHARALLAQPDATVASIARLLHVSRATLYKYVPGLSPAGIRPQAVTAGTAP
jgi:predicted transcriptional regulator